MEQRVGVMEARARFEEVVELIEAGDTFVITKWGMPIAKLVRIEQQPTKAPKS